MHLRVFDVNGELKQRHRGRWRKRPLKSEFTLFQGSFTKQMYRKGCCICKGWFCSSKPNQSLLCVTTIISGQTLTLRAAPRSEKLGYNSLVLQFSTSWTQHDTKREKIYNFKQTPRKPPAFKLRLGCNNCNRYENHLIYAALTNGYLLRSTHMKL